MSWIAAAGSIAGGYLASQGNKAPSVPKWLRWANRGQVENAQQIANTPQQYYPGQTTVGALPSEQAAFGQLQGYDQGMFGDQGSPFSSAMGAMNAGLTGNNPLGQMSGNLAGFAQNQIGNSFGGPSQINPGAYTPQYGQAGGLNATGALNNLMYGGADPNGAMARNLGGQMDWRQLGGAINAANAPLGQIGGADYAGLDQAISAANAPLLRQLNQEIIPGLNTRAQFLNNGTGGIKTLNRVLPEVEQRMAQNAQGLYDQERVRGLTAQNAAAQQAASNSANLVGQYGGQAYGGQQNAIGQINQNRNNAAGLVSQGGLAAYGLGLEGAGLAANQQNQYRSDVLGLGNLAGGLSNDQQTNAARMAALFPSLAQAGRQPATDAAGYAQWQRGLAEQALGADVNRWNFNQQEPMQRASWMNQILGNVNGQPTGGQSGQGASVLGGMIAGGQLGSIFGNAFGLGQTNGTMNSQGVGLSNDMLQQAYGQLNGLNLFGK